MTPLEIIIASTVVYLFLGRRVFRWGLSQCSDIPSPTYGWDDILFSLFLSLLPWGPFIGAGLYIKDASPAIGLNPNKVARVLGGVSRVDRQREKDIRIWARREQQERLCRSYENGEI
jgi:hypothetical protein